MCCVWASKSFHSQNHLKFFEKKIPTSLALQIQQKSKSQLKAQLCRAMQQSPQTRCNPQHFAFYLRAKFKVLFFKLSAHSDTQRMGAVFLKWSLLFPWHSVAAAMCWLLEKAAGPCWCLQDRWTLVGMDKLGMGGCSTVSNNICVFLWSNNLPMGQTV